ncbi:hypothetical protein BKA81DRAFT_212893 [Phyllosticta paracitricarpa]
MFWRGVVMPSVEALGRPQARLFGCHHRLRELNNRCVLIFRWRRAKTHGKSAEMPAVLYNTPLAAEPCINQAASSPASSCFLSLPIDRIPFLVPVRKPLLLLRPGEAGFLLVLPESVEEGFPGLPGRGMTWFLRRMGKDLTLLWGRALFFEEEGEHSSPRQAGLRMDHVGSGTRLVL